MKKCFILVLILSLSLLTFIPLNTSAETSSGKSQNPLQTLNHYLKSKGKKTLNENDLNQALNKAIKKANDLEKNHNSYKVSIPVNGNDKLYGSVKLCSSNSSFAQASSYKATKSSADKHKKWNKYIIWQVKGPAPVNWILKNNGEFEYGKNKKKYAVVTHVRATVEAQATWPYSTSDKKEIDKRDKQGSVYLISGTGYYHWAGLGMATYHGYLNVEVNGTGNVRVKKAKFDW